MRVLASLTREHARDITLNQGRKPRPSVDLRRREFLIRFCQGTGATLVPSTLWGISLPRFHPSSNADQSGLAFQLHPHYRATRPLDTTLAKVQAGLDEFISEKYADQIQSILADWQKALLRSPADIQIIAKLLAEEFSGNSPIPANSKSIRTTAGIQIHRNEFRDDRQLKKTEFLENLRSAWSNFSRFVTAEFQITAINTSQGSTGLTALRTRVRYELVGTGSNFHRQQRIGNWDISWKPDSSGSFLVSEWRVLEEAQAESKTQVYADITAAAIAGNSSYSQQLLHGSDHWRTVLDGACGIDIYGHNGVSVADIDNHGFDDLYICQPAGLPNRLYRNRGDGTFEDVTESSGLGILENTVCALFADYNNDGLQDVILVRANGPLLFLNDGKGKFREKPNAFQFANPPQGTFTGAAVADYDRDGWLDIYFCLYAYYQGTGQYRYPLPYHDAENGPPNFLLRNNRDGTFHDVTVESGLDKNNTRYSFCCGWSDYDRNGWPDLYVVNDFGRKNLYRNNGNGTFTDIAPQAGVEDVGAGMSVSWLDYDRDGAQDLYVANMWTAAGVRVSMQENFKPASAAQVRELYQKHAMGNSLLRNSGQSFTDQTAASGAGMGRWSWSSDAIDFDHDGFSDLYITNGMVSGPVHNDLNSFFWRQVVARSPDDKRTNPEYEQGWNAINELIRSDESWSGYERNIFYANNGDGTFSDIAGVLGLDFAEDGRSFALADIDRDGRLEIILKNRNAPQLRVLKNIVDSLPPSISFQLEGTKSNRDAIGAAITVDTGSMRQAKLLQAGSGFLSQHSKDVFFGLGNASDTVNATILWPSGLEQQLHNLPVNHRISAKEGEAEAHLEPFRTSALRSGVTGTADHSEVLPNQVETWLLSPVAAPDFTLPDLAGSNRALSAFRGQAVLLSVCTAQSQDSLSDLRTLQSLHSRLASRGLRVIALNVEENKDSQAIQSFVSTSHITFPVLQATDDIVAVYNILYRQLFDRHRDLTLPASFLVDSKGDIVKIYQGRIDAAHLEQDFQHIPQSDAERLTKALPFPSSKYSLEFGRNYLSFGALFFQRGYLDQSEAFFQLAFRDDPSSAEALYGIGSVYLSQNKNDAAREIFERAVKLQAAYPDTLPDSWNNLGVIATREGRVQDSIPYFEKALELSPHHLLSLDNLGNAYRLLKRWDDAREVLQRALTVSPDDPEANYGLGMVFAQTNDTDKAYEYLQRALKARPVYPEALNNLGILFLVTHRRDDAVASFEQCIRVAPAFDQAYLNLARVYALEGAREKARGVLTELLKQHPEHAQAKQMLEQLQ
jgi:tetratricopeptide (TPR) repeat protein